MRRSLAFFLCATSLLPLKAHAFVGLNTGVFAHTFSPAWTKLDGPSGTIANDTSAEAIASDSSGNLFVVGYTNAALDSNSMSGNTDGYLVKYNSSGTKLWSLPIGSDFQESDAHGVATDSSGNVYVVGDTGENFYAVPSYLGGNTPIGKQDAFIAKYDTNGARLWTKTLGASTSTSTSYAVAVASSGNIYMTGTTQTNGIDGKDQLGMLDGFLTKYNSSGAKQWTVEFGSSNGNVRAYAIAITSTENIVIAGNNSGAGFDGHSLIGSTDGFLIVYNSSGTKQWSAEFGAASGNLNAFGVTVDSSNNVYVTGSTDKGLNGNTKTGYVDLYLIQYNSTGTVQWTKEIGVSSKWSQGSGIASDGTYVYVTGSSNGNFDGHTLSGTYGMIIVKYDSTGAKKWSVLDGVSSHDTFGDGIAIAGSNIAVAGSTDGNLDSQTLLGTMSGYVTQYNSNPSRTWTALEGGSAPQEAVPYYSATDSTGAVYSYGTTPLSMDGVTQIGSYDAYLTKYNATGTRSWTVQLGASGANLTPGGITTDSSNNVYVAGGTDTGLDGHTLTGAEDMYVFKLNSAGTEQWSAELGVAAGHTYAYSVLVDNSQNVYVIGVTDGGLDGNTLTGSQDLFITKYNSSGAKQWTVQHGISSGYIQIVQSAIDGSGNLFLAGTTDTAIDGNTLQSSNGDLVLFKYNSSGTRIWTSEQGPAAGNLIVNGVTLDSSGNPYVAGTTTGSYDGTTLIGNQDVFITKFSSAGTRQWTADYGVAKSSLGSAGIASDSLGNVYIAGNTNHGIDGYTATGYYDAYLLKYDGSGVRRWSSELGAASHLLLVDSISFDALGNLFVTGESTVSLDSATHDSAYGDLFISKFNGF